MAMIPRFRSLNAQMILSHLMVAILTSVIGMTLIAAGVTYYFTKISPLTSHRQLAVNLPLQWLFGLPDHTAMPEGYGLPEGFGLLVDGTGIVQFSEGDTPCYAR